MAPITIGFEILIILTVFIITRSYEAGQCYYTNGNGRHREAVTRSCSHRKAEVEKGLEPKSQLVP